MLSFDRQELQIVFLKTLSNAFLKRKSLHIVYASQVFGTTPVNILYKHILCGFFRQFYSSLLMTSLTVYCDIGNYLAPLIGYMESIGQI